VNRGAKIDRLSSPPNAPDKFSPKKEIRIGRVPRVAACSPFADADPPGSSLISLGRMHPSAEASGSTSLSRRRWASGGVNHRPICQPKPSATGYELFTATSQECPRTFGLPSLLSSGRHLGFPEWVGCSRISKEPRCILALWLPTLPSRGSLVGWASCCAPKDAPFSVHPSG
jgi:hypothetical protein